MKSLYFIPFWLTIHLSLSIKAHSQQANFQKPSLLIAYNIHERDTLNKNNYEVITMQTDGSGKKNITNHPDVAWTYFAYKDKLFFISDRDTCFRCFFLYETDGSGTYIKKVSDLMLEDSWMSARENGEELIVAGRIGKALRYQLFIMNTTNGSFYQLTNEPSAKYSDPCFSPDGRKIVFSYQKDKSNKSTHEELFIMESDGKNMRQLTTYPENNPSAKEYGYRAGAARWHPTKNFISYVSLQNGKHSIFAITPDAKTQWKLLDNPLSEGYHDWSPDGKWLVYNQSDSEETQYNIILMNWKTKSSKQLTNNEYKSQLSPVFLLTK
jgi:TolB protein